MYKNVHSIPSSCLMWGVLSIASSLIVLVNTFQICNWILNCIYIRHGHKYFHPCNVFFSTSLPLKPHPYPQKTTHICQETLQSRVEFLGLPTAAEGITEIAFPSSSSGAIFRIPSKPFGIVG